MIFVDDDIREVERESNKGSENKNDNEIRIKRNRENEDKSCEENERETNNRSYNVSVNERRRGENENWVYIDKRGSLCRANPRSRIKHLTPPPPNSISKTHSQPNKVLTLNKTNFATRIVALIINF